MSKRDQPHLVTQIDTVNSTIRPTNDDLVANLHRQHDGYLSVQRRDPADRRKQLSKFWIEYDDISKVTFNFVCGQPWFVALNVETVPRGSPAAILGELAYPTKIKLHLRTKELRRLHDRMIEVKQLRPKIRSMRPSVSSLSKERAKLPSDEAIAKLSKAKNGAHRRKSQPATTAGASSSSASKGRATTPSSSTATATTSTTSSSSTATATTSSNGDRRKSAPPKDVTERLHIDASTSASSTSNSAPRAPTTAGSSGASVAGNPRPLAAGNSPRVLVPGNSQSLAAASIPSRIAIARFDERHDSLLVTPVSSVIVERCTQTSLDSDSQPVVGGTPSLDQTREVLEQSSSNSTPAVIPSLEICPSESSLKLAASNPTGISAETAQSSTSHDSRKISNRSRRKNERSVAKSPPSSSSLMRASSSVSPERASSKSKAKSEKRRSRPYRNSKQRSMSPPSSSSLRSPGEERELLNAPGRSRAISVAADRSDLERTSSHKENFLLSALDASATTAVVKSPRSKKRRRHGDGEESSRESTSSSPKSSSSSQRRSKRLMKSSPRSPPSSLFSPSQDSSSSLPRGVRTFSQLGINDTPGDMSSSASFFSSQSTCNRSQIRSSDISSSTESRNTPGDSRKASRLHPPTPVPNSETHAPKRTTKRSRAPQSSPPTHLRRSASPSSRSPRPARTSIVRTRSQMQSEAAASSSGRSHSQSSRLCSVPPSPGAVEVAPTQVIDDSECEEDDESEPPKRKKRKASVAYRANSSNSFSQDSPMPSGIGSHISRQGRSSAQSLHMASSGTYRAICIGCTQFVDPNIADLRCARTDALAVAEALRRGGFSKVSTLVDDPESKEDRHLPLYGNVWHELKVLHESAQRDDTILMYIATHGIRSRSRGPTLIVKDSRFNPNSSINKDTVIPMRDIEQVLTSCKAVRKIVILDCCHQGIEMGRAVNRGQKFVNVNELAEGYAVLSASTARQKAAEDREHGVFTRFLLEALSRQRSPYLREKPYVTVQDLVDHLSAHVRPYCMEKGYLSQEPTFETRGMGDMIVVRYDQQERESMSDG